MLSRLGTIVRAAPFAVAAATLLLLAALSAWDEWRRIELKGYDLLMVLSAPGNSKLPITIVGIDESSLGVIGRQWPWPRRMHGELLAQLNRAGAAVVAFDILFSEPSNQEDDQLFAAAIKQADNVVLTADVVYQETQYARLRLRVEPISLFKTAGAAHGLAAIERDLDLGLRRIPEGQDIFWREIVRRFNRLRPGMIEEPPSLDGKMISYAGPDHTFPYVSYYQALRADTDLPPDTFRDQIVLVGRNVKAAMETGGNEDNFATPFTGWTGWLMPGAEVHANILESALLRRVITPLGWGWNMALVVLATLTSVLLMRRWRPFVNAATGLAVIALVMVGDWLLFWQFNLWLPAMAAMVSVVAVYAALGTYAFIVEQRQRRETRFAFAMYLAPEVVDEIMAHPEKMKLGGERRTITLLFTDLAGFTTMSEQLGPEEVSKLLNEHFTRATRIIKRHGGTVNSFIGDAIMAMWGAPLTNEKHALHACLAARDLQLDMVQLRIELAQRGLPPIAMRVGVNTGTALVGNLGAADRFNYGAIGDSVNLAARLEGINKLYGTEIILSSSTMEELDGALTLRQVDRVVVKGKTRAITIYTITDDASVNRLSVDALQTYESRRWDESESLWRQILLLKPEDKISKLFLERISEFRLQPPPEGWAGEVYLDKY